MITIPFDLPPIVERELRVAARRPVTYWSRVAAASSGMIIIWWVMTAQLALAPAVMAGRVTFRLLAGIAAATVFASVLQLSSEAFAREKREDTLGLLFLTPLQPIDLVVGKLVSTSLAAFYRFLAMIPLIAVPMLVGGVTLADFVLFVLALVNLVFLGATVGLCFSARAWDEKRAGTAATFTMIGLVALLPLAAWSLAAALQWQRPLSLLALSPVFPIWQAVISKTSSSGVMWASFAWTHILAWIFFRAACRILPRCWQTRPAHVVPTADHLLRRRGQQTEPLPPGAPLPPAGRSAVAFQIRQSVLRQFTAHERAQMLDQNPIHWLARRWRPSSTVAWIIAAMAVASCVPFLITGPSDILLSPGLALFVFFGVNAALKTYAATNAGFAFARDRREDPLELLLSTPITPRELIQGHILALRGTLGSWVRRVLWMEAGWLALTIALHASRGREDTWLYVLLSVALLGFLIPDLYAVGWTALWEGVVARNAREAEKEAFMRVLVLPWILAFIVGSLVAFAFTNAKSSAVMGVAIIGCVVFSAAVDWWFMRQSRHNLETKLGLWALRRSAGEFEHYDGWRHAGRRLGQWWRKAIGGR
ncbi:MAG TPA: ABC transporter permease [Methylomirabilota bacterium]|nr:ABC transporter permease [Methylomirabilota bacterium]